MTLVRKNQFSVTLSIDGVPYGVFDKFDGGEIDSSEKKYSPGGMAPEISLGGMKTTGNITISRAYDLQRDGAILATLKAAAGLGQATITKQPLDVNGSPFGAPEVYTGRVKRVTSPSHDSTSGDESMLELEISSNTNN